VSVPPTDDRAAPAPRALEAYFEYALNGIVEATADGRIVRANPAAASILGRSPRRLRDASLDAVLAHDEEARDRLARHNRMLAEQGVSLTTLQIAKDGEPRRIELASVDVGEGSYLHILDDITEQQQLTESLQAARRAADEANAAKSAFLANMSHEIRTPLNGIIGLERLLRLTPLTTQQAEYLDDLRRAAQTLVALLGGVLDLARIESGRFELEARDFDADEFLETVATACGPAAAGRAIRLLFDIEPGIPRQWHGDPLRLAQAANNLLGNAIKFTHTGHVILAVSWSADGGGRLRLAVSDTGSGMTAEQLQRVFSPFVQADPSVTRRHGGSGLGLAIARGIVEAMGGGISASSRPGAGSEFVIEVPMALGGTAASPPAGSVRRALVITDDARQRQALLRLLAAESVAAEPRDADDPMAILASPPDTLLLVDDACVPLLARLQREGRADSLVVVRSRVDAAAIGEAEVTLRAPATPRRLRQAIAQRLRPGPQVTAEANPWEGLRDEYAGAAVLLVEDDAISRRVTLELLSFAGIDVSVADNGRAALDILTATGVRPVQLVFMDVQMPEMDGLTATRTLRTAGIDTPIVALTAGASVEEREACLGAGMNDWLPKPPDLGDLEAVLARWLPARRAPPAEIRAAVANVQDEPRRRGGAAVIDEQAAQQRFLGNRSAWLEALRGFVDVQRPVVERLGALLAAGERETAGRQLHTLAGSAALVGADRLAALARELEAAARAGFTEAPGERLQQLAGAFEEVARAARRL